MGNCPYNNKQKMKRQTLCYLTSTLLNVYTEITSVMSNSLQSYGLLCPCVQFLNHQPPLSMRFSRQEYWSGLSCPPPGDLPNPGIKPTSLTSPALAGGFFTASTTWEAHNIQKNMKSALKGENEGSSRILRGYCNIKLVALGRLFLSTSVWDGL